MQFWGVSLVFNLTQPFSFLSMDTLLFYQGLVLVNLCWFSAGLCWFSAGLCWPFRRPDLSRDFVGGGFTRSVQAGGGVTCRGRAIFCPVSLFDARSSPGDIVAGWTGKSTSWLSIKLL